MSNRSITERELTVLGTEYADFYGVELTEGEAAALAGGDDPIALGFSEGDEYSKLVYDAAADAYRWNHKAMYEIEPEYESYPGWKGDLYEQSESVSRGYFA